MGISLMPYIPDELVLGELEDTVECQGQFHRAQAGSQMPTVLRHSCNDELAYLLGKAFQLKEGIFPDVLRLAELI